MYIYVYLCIPMYIYVYLCISEKYWKKCVSKRSIWPSVQIHGVQERIFAATQVHWHDQGEMEVNKKDGNIKFILTLILMMGIPKLVDHHQNAQNMALTEFPESWKMRMVDRNQGSPRFFGGIPPVPVLICEPSVFFEELVAPFWCRQTWHWECPKWTVFEKIITLNGALSSKLCYNQRVPMKSGGSTAPPKS